MSQQSQTIKGRSVWGLVWLRFRKNKLAMTGLFILLFMMLAILLAPLYVDYKAVVSQRIVNKFKPPSREHWFGTDQFGRDLFARVMYGGRISLFMGLAVNLLASVSGLILGGIAG